MKKQLLLFLVLLVGMFSSFAQNSCLPPSALTSSMHVPNWQNIQLFWTPPTDTISQNLMYSTSNLSTRIGTNGAADFYGAIRFEPSDLTNYNGLSLHSVSFIPGEATSVCSYSILVWQGGSIVDDTSYNAGTLLVEQLITTPLTTNTLNTVILNSPISIDVTQELWIGIRCNTQTGYPLGASNNISVTNKGDLLYLGSTWSSLTSQDLSDYNWVIIGTLVDPNNMLTGYNIYNNSTLLNASPISTPSYLDSVANGTYTYDVTAVYSSGCESSPISTTLTMADNPCIDCNDSVFVGTGTTGQYALPLNTYYNYSVSQQIYTAAELGNIDGVIPCIGFQYINSSNQTKNITVYMGNTSKSSFSSSSDWIPFNNMVMVYNGPIDFVAGNPNYWVNIPLTIPFEWDGASNIVVAVVNNTGSYSDNSNTFYTHTASQMSLYASNDNAAYNIQSLPIGTVGSSRNNIRFMVGDPVSCPMPTQFTVSNITHESANLSWSSRGIENGYEIVIVPEGSSFDNETPIALTDTFYTLANLTDNTEYTIFLHSLCSSENSSWWQISFRTECLPVATLPYTENFETYSTGSNAYPYCWQKIANGSYPYIISDSYDNGIGSLYFYSTSATSCYAILPAMDETIDVSSLTISFMAKASATNYGHIDIGVMSDPTDPSTFTTVKTLYGSDYNATNTWQQFFVYLQNYTGDGQYIAFRSPSDYTSYTYIDNVNVDYTSGCGQPTNLTVNEVGGTYAMFSWTPSELISSSIEYVFEYSEQGQDNWNNVTTTNLNSYTLTGLEPLTNYDVKFYVICDDGSSDTLTTSFLTNCLSGGDITIGNGTNTDSYLPCYSFYNYSYTQQLFLASEFNGANTLHSVAFNVSSVNTPVRNIDIYLMHTTANTISAWLPIDSAVLVFSGNTAFTTGWNTFNFNTIFNYNGTDNLVLIVDDNTGSYNSSNYFLTHTGSSGCSRYIYSDGTNYNPATVTGGTSSSYRNNVIFGGECDSTATCIAPTIFVNNIANNSVDLSWIPGYNESEWELEYCLASDTNWIFLGSQTALSYELDNLLSNTAYKVRLRSNCGGSYSDYTLTTFTTECDYVDSLPFIENFDSYTSTGSTSYMSCWKRLYSSSSAYPYISSSYSTSGTKSLYFYNASNTNTIAIFPRFSDDIEMDNLLISFNAYFTSTSYSAEVGIMTDPYDASTFTSLGIIHPENASVFEAHEIISNQYTGNGHYLAIRGLVGTDNYFYLDDIHVDVIPSCMHVSDIVISNIDSSSATASWTAGGDESEWEIIVIPTEQTTNVNLDTCISNISYAPTFDITDLESATQYTIYVRANCDAGEQSFWITMNFQTSQVPGQLPFECDFETTSNWGFSNGSLPNQWCIGTATNNGGTHAMYISNDNGVNNTYTTTSSSTVWAFRDIYFPANSFGYLLSFDWKAYGESCCDYIRLFYGDPIAPTAGSSSTIPSGLTPIAPNINSSYPNYFNLNSSFSNFSTTIPGFSTDGVRRIYFMWRNDSSVGTQPPAAIDNVYISAIYCPAPTSVTVSAITANSATVSWTENGNATNWNIQYKATNDNAWTEITNVANPTTLTGLTSNQNYMVRVLADCNDGEYSPLSSSTSFQTLETCPAPTNLVVTSTTNTSATINWTVVGSENSWNLIYGVTGFNPASGGTNVTVTTHPYEITGLSNDNTYDVYIQADCGAGDESALVGPIYVTPGSFFMPSTGNHSISACGGHIYDDGGPLGEYSNNCNATLTINPDASGMVVVLNGTFDIEESWDFLSIYDGNSTNGTLLWSSANYGQSGTISNISSTTGPLTLLFTSDASVGYDGFDLTVSCEAGGTPSICNTPTNLQVSVGINTATATWTAGGTETSWNVQYRTANGSWSNSIATTTPTYTFNNLTASTAYEVRVQAVCDNNETSDWTTTSFTTNSEQGCPTPTNFHVANNSNGNVTLAWEQEAGTATEWGINYKKTSDQTWTSITVTTNPYTITNLEVDADYQAQIEAHCTNGTTSGASAIINFTATSINDYLLNESVSLIPNPATNYIDVLVNNDNIAIQELQVYDVYGKLLQTVTVNSNPTRIKISNLAAGMYMVRIVGETGLTTKSFIKK